MSLSERLLFRVNQWVLTHWGLVLLLALVLGVVVGAAGTHYHWREFYHEQCLALHFELGP